MPLQMARPPRRANCGEYPETSRQLNPSDTLSETHMFATKNGGCPLGISFSRPSFQGRTVSFRVSQKMSGSTWRLNQPIENMLVKLDHFPMCKTKSLNGHLGIQFLEINKCHVILLLMRVVLTRRQPKE